MSAASTPGHAHRAGSGRPRRFLPRTRLGRRSLLAVGVLVVGAAAQALLVRGGAQGAWLAVLGLPALAGGLAACPTAVVAILRRRERSPLVFLAGLVGLFVWILLIGELAHPH